MAKAAKGSAFERSIAKQLSLWWSHNESDSIFWRTSNSGGRATTRSKKGSTTKNQYGDLAATDPSGQPLIDLIMIELKRGYNRNTLHELLDKRPKHKCLWEDWIVKAEKQSTTAKIPFWMIIAQRDQRSPIVVIPEILHAEFPSSLFPAAPKMSIEFLSQKSQDLHCVVSLMLDDFITLITPEKIKQLSEGCK